MRIEVLINQVESHLYPLSQPKIMIGSSRSCDIVVTAEGISRKHIMVVCEDDNYFVIDQGSTNGSYINEERLTPGRRVPFTSFFPVRLGDSILLTLLSDDATRGQTIEALNLSKADASSPSITSIKNSSQTIKTVNSVKFPKNIQRKKDKEERRHSKDSPKKKNEADSKLFLSLIIAGLIILVAAYIEIFGGDVEPEITSPTSLTKEAPPAPPEAVKEKIALISSDEATSRVDLETLINDLKCISDNEKLLCDAIPAASVKGWGVTQIGTTLNVFIDADPLIEKSHDYFAAPDKNSPQYEIYEKQRNLILVGLLLKEGITQDLMNERLKGFKLVFGLFKKVDGERKLLVAFGGYPESIEKLRENLSDSLFNSIKQYGLKNKLDLLNSYIILY